MVSIDRRIQLPLLEQCIPEQREVERTTAARDQLPSDPFRLLELMELMMQVSLQEQCVGTLPGELGAERRRHGTRPHEEARIAILPRLRDEQPAELRQRNRAEAGVVHTLLHLTNFRLECSFSRHRGRD